MMNSITSCKAQNSNSNCRYFALTPNIVDKIVIKLEHNLLYAQMPKVRELVPEKVRNSLD